MLSERQERLCTESRWDFSDLSAIFLNCTLKRSPERSHTEGLIRVSRANEDGAKHCAMNILYSLQHLGYVIPPQADAAWLGEAGPGPSYLDEGSGGPENDFTNRNTAFMTWNLLHMARMIKDAGGIAAHGNQRSAWDAGCRSDHPNPLYR